MLKNALLVFSFIMFCLNYSNSLSILKKYNEKIVVSGYVKLIDSEPFSRAVLEIENGEIISLPDSFKIDHKDYLYKKITIEGKLKQRKLISADKKYTIIEYYFDTYKIID